MKIIVSCSASLPFLLLRPHLSQTFIPLGQQPLRSDVSLFYTSEASLRWCFWWVRPPRFLSMVLLMEELDCLDLNLLFF